MKNNFKFLSFSSNPSIERDAEIILFENNTFFNNLAKLIIESSTISNIKVTFTSSNLKKDHKYKEVTFSIEGILFSLFNINYHIDGDQNEIVREFEFTVCYLE